MFPDVNNGEQVPIIDLSLKRGGPEHHDSDRLYTEVRKACEDWGCFLAVNHGIKEEILQEMDSVAREAFHLPKETKEKNRYARPDTGYVSGMPAFPFLEILAIPGAPNPVAIQEFSDQLWPQGNPKTSQIIQAYACGVEEFTINIIKLIMASFGVSKYYRASDFNGILRMNYCNLPPEEKGGLATHTDYNFLTVIYQDKAGGLKVLNKAGKWIDVKPVANSFVVIMGDCSKAWSNGRIHSVVHRVICESSRVSVPYFYSFTDTTVIHVPEELVDDEHPLLYKPFLCEDYRNYSAEEKFVQYKRPNSFLIDTGEAPIDKFARISSSLRVQGTLSL